MEVKTPVSQSQVQDLDTREPLKTAEQEDYMIWYMLQLEEASMSMRKEGGLQSRKQIYKSKLG